MSNKAILLRGLRIKEISAVPKGAADLDGALITKQVEDQLDQVIRDYLPVTTALKEELEPPADVRAGADIWFDWLSSLVESNGGSEEEMYEEKSLREVAELAINKLAAGMRERDPTLDVARSVAKCWDDEVGHKILEYGYSNVNHSVPENGLSTFGDVATTVKKSVDPYDVETAKAVALIKKVLAS